MKALLLVLTMLWSFNGLAQVMDEADIPPPPMPDYMKKAGYKSAQVREPTAVDDRMEDQTGDEIKEDFLMAAEEDTEVKPVPAVAEVIDGPINEPPAPREQIETYRKELAAQEQNQQNLKESQGEYEQAGLEDESVKEEYLRDPVEQAQAKEPIAGDNPEVEAPAPQLAEVEERLEAAEQAAEEILESPRQPSNKASFKAGMYKFDEDCVMHSEPDSLSENAGVIKAGRKLWIDAHSDEWHKAYKKNGTVYIKADCLNK